MTNDIEECVRRRFATYRCHKEIQRCRIINGMMHAQAQYVCVQNKTHGWPFVQPCENIVGDPITRGIGTRLVETGVYSWQSIQHFHAHMRVDMKYRTIYFELRQCIAPLAHDLPALN